MHPEDIGQYVSDSTFEIIGSYVFQQSYALDVQPRFYIGGESVAG